MDGNTVEEIAVREYRKADMRSKNAVYQGLCRTRKKLFDHAETIVAIATAKGIRKETIVQVMDGLRAQGTS